MVANYLVALSVWSLFKGNGQGMILLRLRKEEPKGEGWTGGTTVLMFRKMKLVAANFGIFEGIFDGSS